MIEKIRKLYEEKLAVKIVSVIIVVFASVVVILPVIKLAEFLGINIRDNSGLNFKVDLPQIFFFFLFGTCSIMVIWLAQKYLHKAKLADLGFRKKVFQFLLIGFLFGALRSIIAHGIMILNAGNVTYTSVIPDNVSIWTYAAYYAYFMIGFIVWNSLIEELGTRAYPIAKLRKHLNPHLIFTIMGIIFTVGHFVLNDYNISYGINLFTSSYIFSLVYYYSNSIWLVVGMHSGMNWVAFSFFGSNWKLGTLIQIQRYDTPSWIANYTEPFIGLTCLLFIIFLHKKGFFKKYTA
jgi:membrane protease YdiL (CAAX protease family)